MTTLPKDIRYQSVRWILAKNSTEAKEAKRHGVTIKAVRNWITRYKKEHGQLPNPKVLASRGEPVRSDLTPTRTVVVPTPPSQTPGGNEDAFTRALESAGASADSGGDPEPISEDPTVPSEPLPVDDGPPPPEVKPDDLIAFAEMVVTEIPYGFAVLKGIEVPRESLAFTDDERKSLKLTAPYAAQYAPPIFAKAPAAMAVVFVGTLLFATVRRLGFVKHVIAEKEAAKAEIRKAEQAEAPEDQSRTPKVSSGGKDSYGFPS